MKRLELDRSRMLKLLLTFVLPLLLFLLRPFGMNRHQSLVLGALVLVILWWVTGAVNRTAASAFLLVFFLLFSGAPARTVLTFPCSENFLMIAFSFLFSQGVSNSGLTDRLLGPLLGRYARTVPRLLCAMLLCALTMIFVIPQPFSRIIILSLIFSNYFDKVGLGNNARPALLFALYLFSILINMAFLRGDIILSGALLSMGGVALDEGTWMRYMLPPTLGLLSLAAALYLFLFRRDLRGCTLAPAAPAQRTAFTRREILWLVFLLAVVLLWATEDFHGVSATLVAVAGTALMFPLGLLHLPDLKSVNVKLLLFLTAAFSIGGVMKASGVADLLFSRFTPLFPSAFSVPYAAIALACAIALHMLLGSNITTMSVVVPGLLSIGAGVAPAVPLLLLIYVAVSGHFLLPFHHVILLLGEGNGSYTSRHVLRYGLPLTVVTFLSALVLYLGWWTLTGLL